jgi:hypothetical protein
VAGSPLGAAARYRGSRSVWARSSSRGAPRPNARSPRSPDYEIPAEFSLDAYRERDAWELGDEDDPGIRTRVRFEFPTSLWAARNTYGSLEEELSDGSSIRSFEVRQLNPFLRWILALEGRARVVDPPQVGAEVASLARDALALYAAEDETGNVSESAGPGGDHG